MPTPISDQALLAFRRVLADAAQGGQSKIDALVALSQRTVWVATWTSLGDDYRTLVNSNGVSALPVFTGLDALEDAAKRFGWQTMNQITPHREVGAREVLRHAIAHNLQYVVVDIANDHSLEIERAEIEPLIRAPSRSESTGPYAAVGRISSDMMKAVKSTSSAPPGSLPSVRPPSVPVAAKVPNFSTTNSKSSVPPPGPMVDGAGSGKKATVSKLLSEPSEHLEKALTEALRGYPEVEWAALCLVSHGPGGPVPSCAVRVDPAFRQRVGEITIKLRRVSEGLGTPLGTLIVDDPEIMRTVRMDGMLFFPWKQRSA